MRTPHLATAILSLLHHHHLLSAPEIVTHFQTDKKPYNKTSVYRSLEKLLAENKICKQVFGDAEAVYEPIDHHHDHLVCQICRKIESLDCSYQQPKKIHGFRIDHHHLTFMGVCRNCQKNYAQKK